MSAAPAQLDGVDGDDLVIEFDSSTALVRAVLAAGPDAVVQEPPALRDAVVAALDAMVVQ